MGSENPARGSVPSAGRPSVEVALVPLTVASEEGTAAARTSDGAVDAASEGRVSGGSLTSAKGEGLTGTGADHGENGPASKKASVGAGDEESGAAVAGAKDCVLERACVGGSVREVLASQGSAPSRSAAQVTGIATEKSGKSDPPRTKAAFSVDAPRAESRASFKEVYRQEQGSLLAGRYAAVGMHSLPGSSALLKDAVPPGSAPRARSEKALEEAADTTAAAPMATMGVNGAFFNLANCCLGCTLVALPSVCYNAGAVPFVVCMIITAVMALLSADMVVKAADVTGLKSLEMIGVRAFGSRRLGILGTTMIIIIGLYVPLTVYIAVLKKTMPVAKDMIQFITLGDAALTTIVVVLLVFPLCLIRDQAWLAFSSMLCLTVFLSVAVMTGYSLISDTWYQDHSDQLCAVEPGKGGLELWGKGDLIQSIKSCSPIMVAFVFHTSVLPIYQQMKEQTPKNMQIVNRRSVLTAFSFYTFMGLCGAMAFKSNVAGTILENFRHCKCIEWKSEECTSPCTKWGNCADWDANIAGTILCLVFTLAIVVGFPNLHFTVRSVQVSTFWPGEDAEFSWAVHTAYAVFNVTLCSLIGMFVSIDKVFDWAGVFTSPLQAFLLPAGYFFLTSRRSTFDHVSSSVVLTFGFLVMGVGTYLQAMTE